MNLKEKLISLLGSTGLILFYLLRVFISVLPFVMIDLNFFVTFLLIFLNFLLPALSTPVFWIWGLVCAINGVQDFFAIFYYVVFAIVYLPFFIGLIYDLIKLIVFKRQRKDKIKNKEPNKTLSEEKHISPKSISQFMECSFPPSPVDQLSIDTVLCWQEFKEKANPQFLSKNDLVQYDMVLFACFITRASVIAHIKNGFEARMFDSKYIKQVLLGADSLFTPRIDINEMFENRMDFYDELIAEGKDLSALFEEFEYIIKTDIINDGIYEPFSKSSPLPILSFETDFFVRTEVQQFVSSYIPYLFEKHSSNVINFYKF